MNGKGDKPRPYNKKKFDKNYDRIFKRKEKDESSMSDVRGDENKGRRRKRQS